MKNLKRSYAIFLAIFLVCFFCNFLFTFSLANPKKWLTLAYPTNNLVSASVWQSQLGQSKIDFSCGCYSNDLTIFFELTKIGNIFSKQSSTQSYQFVLFLTYKGLFWPILPILGNILIFDPKTLKKKQKNVKKIVKLTKKW